MSLDIRDALDRARLRLGTFGHHLHYFLSVGSTNDVASTLAANGAPEGTVIVADMQTAGRGRRGHDWFSPPGAGLYVSIVFRPVNWPDGQAVLTLMAGVALADAILASTGLQTEIKWPNDLVVGPRKLAGILAEASGEWDPVILGYGVNLTRAVYPSSISERATSIEHELGRVPDRGVVLAESLAALATGHAQLVSGRFDAILSRWRALSRSSEGATVEWTTPHGRARGTTAGIDERGALLVRVGPRVERIAGGTVTWL